MSAASRQGIFRSDAVAPQNMRHPARRHNRDGHARRRTRDIAFAVAETSACTCGSRLLSAPVCLLCSWDLIRTGWCPLSINGALPAMTARSDPRRPTGRARRLRRRNEEKTPLGITRGGSKRGRGEVTLPSRSLAGYKRRRKCDALRPARPLRHLPGLCGAAIHCS